MKNKQAIIEHNITDPSSRRTYKRHLRQNTRPFSLLITLLLFFTITFSSLKFFTQNTVAFQPDEFVTTWNIDEVRYRLGFSCMGRFQQ